MADKNLLTTPLGQNISDYDQMQKQVQQQSQLMKEWGTTAIDPRGLSNSLNAQVGFKPSVKEWLPSEVTSTPVELYDINTGNTIKTYNNIVDYQRDTLVAEGGMEKPAEVSWAEKLTAAVPTIGGSSLIGLNLGGPLGLAAGAAVGIAGYISSIAGANQSAYDAYAKDPERTISLIAEEAEQDGGKTVKINPERAAAGTAASGEYTKSLQEGADIPLTWDDTGLRLNVNIAPAFAASDAYKDISTYFNSVAAGLTRDNDTNGETLTQLNNYIISAQNQYFYDQQQLKVFTNKYPNASMDAIDTGIANQLAGYFSDESDLKDYKLSVYDNNNNLVEKSAEEVFNTVYNMKDSVEKDRYIGKLNAALADPTISEDSKALIYGQLNALYLANRNEKTKYFGMLEKTLGDHIAEQGLVLGLSINDVASLLSFGESYGDLKYLTNNEIAQGVVGVAGGVLNMAATMKVMDITENVLKFAGEKGLSALGKMGNQVFGTGNRLTQATDWIIQRTQQAGSIAAFQEIGANGIASKALPTKIATMGLDLGYQALADLSVDLAKVGIQSLAGKETDFWHEFQQDFTMDLLFTYAHTGALQYALASSGLKSFSVADIQRVIRESSDVRVDSDTGVKTLTISFDSKRPDVEITIKADTADGKIVDVKGLTAKEYSQALVSAHYAINNQASQLAAKLVTAAYNVKPIRYVYEKWFDNKINMKILGYQKLAETGDYTDLVKLSNLSNSRRVYSEAFQDFLQLHEGQKVYDGINAAAVKFTEATGSKKFTAKDNAYLNAKQELQRIAVNEGTTSETYKNAEAYYAKYISGVDKTRALALDEYAKSLIAFAKKLNLFEQSEGMETSSFFDMIQKYPNYFPVFSKPSGSGSGREVEYRRTHRQTDEPYVLLDPKEMDSPTSSTMRMMQNVMYNVARTRQLKQILDTAQSLGGIRVEQDSETRQDYEDLPTAELIKRYNIPEPVRAEMRKLADTEASYKKSMDNIMEKSLLTNHVEDYMRAKAQLQTNAQKTNTNRTTYRTVEGDPLLTTSKGGYKKGMTEQEVDEYFLSQIQTSISGIMAGARRHNYKMRKYYTVETPKSVERIMQEVREDLPSFDPTAFITKITNELNMAAPMVTYDQLIVSYIPRTVERRDELLADEDIMSGKAAYDAEHNTKVMGKGAPIRIYSGGKVETYYLRGETEADQQKANAVVEVMNSGLQAPVRNGFLRVLNNVAVRTARIKRNLVNGLLPSRAAPNKLRDAGQAAIAIGSSAIMSPRRVFEDLIDSGLFSDSEVQSVLGVLDRIDQQTQAYLENEVVYELQHGTIASAQHLASKPQRPTASQQFGLRPLQRTANQIKYQFRSIAYNAKQLFRGGGSEILMTPGNLLEANTRRTAGQNTMMLELIQQRQMGVDFETALANAYSRGAWAARTSTTDFATKGAITEMLARWTPFSYASFSDFSSKLESWVLDPIGVSSRMVTYLAAYSVNLASMLADEDSRKRYMNLSEYERTHNLIIPDGSGGILKIPFDEGMAGITAPFRIFTEALAYQEPVTFWKVFGSILDVLPLDLSGFTEGDRFNLQRGVEVLVDAQAPALVSMVAEMATGRDFFYGKDLRVDENDLAVYGQTTESAGDFTTSGNNSKTLRWLADTLNWPQWRIQQAVSVFGGTIGEYVVYTLDKLQGATDKETYGRSPIEAFYKPFVSTTENVESAFYDVLDELEAEHQALLPKLLAKTKAITIATGAELTQLKLEHQQLLDDFAVKAADAIQKYLTVYNMTGGLTEDQAKRVYYLFDFADDYLGASFVAGTAGSSAADKLKTQYRYQAQKGAASALAGKYTAKGLYRKSDGTYERATPFGMSGLQALEYNQTNEYLAAIENIVKRQGLRDGYSQVYNARQAIYNKGTLTSADYDQLDKLAIEWDVKLMTALWPYLEKYGIDHLTDSAVVDYLDGLLIVTSDYEVDKKGKHISAPRLNKQRGFASSFLKAIAEKIGG